MTTSYRTNLTDEQWEIIKTLVPEAKPEGRPRTVDMKEILNGIFYILAAGCAWHLLPHDFPRRENGLSLFSTMAHSWRLGTDSRTTKAMG